MSSTAIVDNHRFPRRPVQQAARRIADEVEIALASRVNNVTRRGVRMWSFYLAPQDRACAYARIDEDWLSLTVPMDTPNGSKHYTPWTCLENSSSLGGAVKWALAGEERGLYARGDLALSDIDPCDSRVLQARLDAMCDGLRSARGVARVRQARLHEIDDCPLDLDWVEASCTDAGWHCERSSEGDCRVALQSPAPIHVSVRVEHDGARFRLRGELCPGDALPTGVPHKQAVATFLLVACGSVRLVRPYAADAIGLESPMPAQCRASDIHRSLSALSVAYAISGRETLALIETPSLADNYLKLRPFGAQVQALFASLRKQP